VEAAEPLTAVPSVGSLFAEYADGVFTLAYRIVGDRHLAEDVVQETFLKVLRRLHTYRGEGPIAAWLYRIGYREAIAALRSRRDAPTDPEDMARISERPEADAAEAVLRRELVERLDAAIATLSPPLRAAFVLRDVEGLGTAAVAAALSVSESAVKMRLARAREALRVQLKEYLR